MLHQIEPSGWLAIVLVSCGLLLRVVIGKRPLV